MPQVKLGPEQGPFETREPKDNGGGNKVECPPGSYMSAIQLGKDPDGQRWINIWHRKITIE